VISGCPSFHRSRMDDGLCHDFLLAQRRMMGKPRSGLKNSSLTLHGEFCGLISSHYVLL
ncbi:unnamed protein product, partial [Musa banksii]